MLSTLFYPLHLHRGGRFQEIRRCADRHMFVGLTLLGWVVGFYRAVLAEPTDPAEDGGDAIIEAETARR
jgi:hypothetical protein